MSKKERKKRQEARERGELKKRLLTYSMAAGAALIGAQAAKAGIVYSGPQDLLADVDGETVYIDMNNNGNSEFGVYFWANAGTFSTTYTSYGYTYSYHSYHDKRGLIGRPQGGLGVVMMARTAGQSVVNYAKSATIGPGTNWRTQGEHLAQAGTRSGVPESWGPFLGSNGYIGVKFSDGGSWYIGWVGLEVPADAAYGRVTGWAYEDTGATILAGAGEPDPDPIPEPGGLALLATGAAGLMVFRKKRTE